MKNLFRVYFFTLESPCKANQNWYEVSAYISLISSILISFLFWVVAELAKIKESPSPHLAYTNLNPTSSFIYVYINSHHTSEEIYLKWLSSKVGGTSLS